jgi:hypothetical protein
MLHYKLSRAFSAKAVCLFINLMLVHQVEINSGFQPEAASDRRLYKSGFQPEAASDRRLYKSGFQPEAAANSRYYESGILRETVADVLQKKSG